MSVGARAGPGHMRGTEHRAAADCPSAPVTTPVYLAALGEVTSLALQNIFSCFKRKLVACGYVVKDCKAMKQ